MVKYPNPHPLLQVARRYLVNDSLTLSVSACRQVALMRALSPRCNPEATVTTGCPFCGRKSMHAAICRIQTRPTCQHLLEVKWHHGHGLTFCRIICQTVGAW